MSNYPDTQKEAFASIVETLPEARRHVLYKIANAGPHGISTLSISQSLSWPINCVSGRITELTEAGLIKDSGRRCVNPSGRRAILWIIPPTNGTYAFHFDESGQGEFC